MSENNPTLPAAPAQPAPERRPYRVTWLHRDRGPHGGDRFQLRTWQVTAESPERAISETMVGYYGCLRPALAPDRCTVDGVSYLVDEWTETNVYAVPEADIRAADRARAERGLRHLRAAKAALEGISDAGHQYDLHAAFQSTIEADRFLARRLAELDASDGGAL